ncbi:MAG: acetyltransferase [Chloroflexi bacterium]|nr:acetyltransferase [Chloroflexota bacterium]
MSGKQKLVILGAGAFAEEVADLVSDLEIYEIVAFVEGLDRSQCSHKLSSIPVIWIDDLGQLAPFCKGICAVGSTKRKEFIQQALSLGLEFTTVVHPAAWVSRTASLGPGTMVSSGSIISAYTKVGSHVLINRGSLIGSHGEIGDYVTISPGANLADTVRVGTCTYIGMGAIILESLSVGNNAVVGAGTVVTRDVLDSMQVLGSSARMAKVTVE